MNTVDTKELDRRATLIVDRFKGINPPYEAFYIRSIMYSAGRACAAFERFDIGRAAGDSEDGQVSSIHEALGHAASLSRFFWPSGLAVRASATARRLRSLRAEKLRRAFRLTDESPLKDRRLRDSLEHFDERLDIYLLGDEVGHFFPDAIVGDLGLGDVPVRHVFKLVDPKSSCFVLLGQKHYFGELRAEVARIHDAAYAMDSAGSRLSPPGL